jgi:hypothetical protein
VEAVLAGEGLQNGWTGATAERTLFSKIRGDGPYRVAYGPAVTADSEVTGSRQMSSLNFSLLRRGVRWFCIAIIMVAALAACGPNNPQGSQNQQGNNSPAQNEGVLNQNSGGGP